MSFSTSVLVYIFCGLVFDLILIRSRRNKGENIKRDLGLWLLLTLLVVWPFGVVATVVNWIDELEFEENFTKKWDKLENILFKEL